MSDLISRKDAISALKTLEESAPTAQHVSAIFDCEDTIRALSPAESAHKAPISFEEQLSLDCNFCRQHECGDTLYESVYWDGGVSFDYIRDIRFCPICGRELYGYENEERRGK